MENEEIKKEEVILDVDTTVEEEFVGISEDGKEAIFKDGGTVPIISREELVAEIGEEAVAKIEAEAVPVSSVDEIAEAIA